MLQIYNTLTKKKDIFEPLVPNKINLYVCGVTVYDYCHIGHARTYLVFDVIIRYLRWRGFTVKYVRNITDIEDKIIKRATENNETTDELVARFINIMNEEFDSLNILRPDVEPRATQTISQMIEMIQVLVDKGYAYQTESGDVCYKVSQFKDYGKLSGQNIEQLRAGTRVEVDQHKQDPLDFVLWKPSKQGEPSWESPWGAGRPGWHLECSCMAKANFGDYFDIHGGGSDLRFPHHENEIAQSEAANESPFAKYWLHSGMVRVNEEKMSKSLGNFFIIHDVLQQYPAEVVRYFLIAAHYRSEINYSEENLNAAQGALTSLYTALRGLPTLITGTKLDSESQYTQRFVAAMDDDFNTPEAIAVLFDLTHEINRLKKADDKDAAVNHGCLLRHLADVLGILQQDPEQFLQGGIDIDAVHVEMLIKQRNVARDNKDWATADSIRDQLTEMGIALEDDAKGTIWRKDV